MRTTRRNDNDQPGKPVVEQDTGSLPSAVTFFIEAHHRRALLAALKGYSDDRSRAILIALGLIDSE